MKDGVGTQRADADEGRVDLRKKVQRRLCVAIREEHVTRGDAVHNPWRRERREAPAKALSEAPGEVSGMRLGFRRAHATEGLNHMYAGRGNGLQRLHHGLKRCAPRDAHHVAILDGAAEVLRGRSADLLLKERRVAVRGLNVNSRDEHFLQSVLLFQRGFQFDKAARWWGDRDLNDAPVASLLEQARNLGTGEMKALGDLSLFEILEVIERADFAHQPQINFLRRVGHARTNGRKGVELRSTQRTIRCSSRRATADGRSHAGRAGAGGFRSIITVP